MARAAGTLLAATGNIRICTIEWNSKTKGRIHWLALKEIITITLNLWRVRARWEAPVVSPTISPRKPSPPRSKSSTSKSDNSSRISNSSKQCSTTMMNVQETRPAACSTKKDLKCWRSKKRTLKTILITRITAVKVSPWRPSTWSRWCDARVRFSASRLTSLPVPETNSKSIRLPPKIQWIEVLKRRRSVAACAN